MSNQVEWHIQHIRDWYVWKRKQYPTIVQTTVRYPPMKEPERTQFYEACRLEQLVDQY